jgi:hypothetical protein
LRQYQKPGGSHQETTSLDEDSDSEKAEKADRQCAINASSALIRLQFAGAATRQATDDSDVLEVASTGLDGPAQELPHAEQIQASFGVHDVSGIDAHVGGDAATAANEIGADAYAMGDGVAFATAPDLHTAAHEAAHVVQQRAGVHLKGGVGESGDVHERHADQVADLVVRGESAEEALNQVVPGSQNGSAVQKRDSKKTAYTQQDNSQLVSLLLQEAAAEAKQHYLQYFYLSAPSANDEKAYQRGCKVVANRLERAIHAANVPQGKSAKLKSLFKAADVAYHGAAALRGVGESGPGSDRLGEMMMELWHFLEPAGWHRPKNAADARKRMTSHNSTTLALLPSSS